MALLRYEFDIIGQHRVAAALASNERIFATHASKINRIVGASSRGGARSEAAAADRSAAQSARARQREIDAISRAQVALSRQRTREETAATKAARDASRDKQRAIDAQSRSQAALGRQREREERIAATSARNIARERMRFVQGTVGRGTGRVINSLSAVGTAGLAMVGVGGAALAASAVQQAMRLDQMSRRLAIQGRAEGAAGRKPEVLQKAFTDVGIATGLAPEQVAAGAAAYVQRTGDLDTAMANLDTFATTAQATGASIEDVARAAADMAAKLDIKSVDDMRRALALLTMQGKRGAFELKDMSVQFPEMAAEAANIGVRGVQGVRELGSIAQVAMQATGSGAEASTSVQALFRQLKAKSEGIQNGSAFSSGRKVQVFEGGDAKKPMRNFLDVVGDVMQATGGNVVELQDIFDIRGIRAVNPLIAAYREANQKAGGGAGGDKAGRAAMQRVLSPFLEAPDNYGEIQRDASDAMKSVSVQLEQLNNKLKEAIASELFPAIQKLVPELIAMAPHLAALMKSLVRLTTWLAKNPIEGLGATLAASIAYEIAKAGIGAAASSALTQILLRAQVAGGVAALPGAAGVAGVAGTALKAGAAGVIGAAAGGALGEAISGGSGADTGMRVGGLASAGAVLGGPVGALVGTSAGMLWDSIASLRLQLETFSFGDEPGKTRESSEARRLQDEAVNKQLEQLAQNLSRVNDVTRQIDGDRPNRGNAPSPVKN